MWLTDTKIDRVARLLSGRRKDLGHFWVTQSLCFKTRAMAKPSKWKYYDFLFSSLANKTPFRKKGFALWNLGFLEHFGNGLLLLFKYPGADCPGYTSKGDLHSLLVLWFSLASLGPWDTQWKRVYQRIFVKHAHFFSVCSKSVFGEERRCIVVEHGLLTCRP